MKLLISAIFFININSLYADTKGANFEGKKLIDSTLHSEKVFIHTNNTNYYAGENIWFKAYVVSANSNRPDAISKIVHVDLIDPLNNIIASRAIKISEGGGGGEFYLRRKLVSGKYTIRGYTNFMRNLDQAFFFRKSIHVQSAKTSTTKTEEKQIAKKLDMQFFPEGGYTVEDQISQIGFKITDEFGRGINVSGSIIDENRNVITEFSSLKFGMGMFKLTPKKGKSYKALVKYEANEYGYDLPVSLKEGVVMKVRNNNYYYTISLSSSLPKGVDALFFLAQQRGEIVSRAKLIGRKNKGHIRVLKRNLNEGIAQFTIFDSTGKPLCERLVFVQKNHAKSTISIQPRKNEFSRRELITIDLELDSIQPANISLAVTDISSVKPDLYALDIKSHLLLNSELKGEIEQPSYYFESKDSKREAVLDLLMMTQGWRQFLWANDGIENKVNYLHERGISFKGFVKKLSDFGKINNVELSLTFKNKNEIGHDKVTADHNGSFKFGDYHFNDSTNIIIQAKKFRTHNKTRGKKLKNPNGNFEIVLESYVPPPIKTSIFPSSLEGKEIISDRIPLTNEVASDTEFSFEKEYEKLDEVLLKSKKRIAERFKDRNMLYSGAPSNRLDFETVNTAGFVNVLNALTGRIPGVDIRNNSEGTSVRITRFSSIYPAEPLFLVDNVPVPSLDFVIPSDVSFVDVLKGGSRALFGSRGQGGVIAVYTKRANEDFVPRNSERKGIINFIHPGYYTTRKFYSPNYKTAKPNHKEFDSRSNLYWNPRLKFNEKGNSQVSFYAADLDATYKVEIQGINNEGLPIKKETFIEVK